MKLNITLLQARQPRWCFDGFVIVLEMIRLDGYQDGTMLMELDVMHLDGCAALRKLFPNGSRARQSAVPRSRHCPKQSHMP